MYLNHTNEISDHITHIIVVKDFRLLCNTLIIKEIIMNNKMIITSTLLREKFSINIRKFDILLLASQLANNETLC